MKEKPMQGKTEVIPGLYEEPEDFFRVKDPMIHLEGMGFDVESYLGQPPIFGAIGQGFLPLALTGGAVLGLGSLLGVRSEDVVPAAILGGVGMGTLFVGRLVPPSIQPLTTILGIGGIIGGAAFLFSGAVQASEQKPKSGLPAGIPPRDVPKGEEIPELPPQDLRRLLEVQAVPSDAQPDGQQWSGLNSHLFQFVARNNASNRTLSFYAGAAVYGENAELLQVTPPQSRVLVTLEPQETKTVGLFIPSAGDFNIRPVGKFDLTFGENVAVEAQIFRSRDDGIEVTRTESISITLGLVG